MCLYLSHAALLDSRMAKSIGAESSRKQIVWLWLTGCSALAISKKTGVSLSTVYRWIRRWQAEGTVETRPHRRRSYKNLNECRELIDNSTWPIALPKDERVNVCRNISSLALANCPVIAYSPFIDGHHTWPYSCFSRRFSLLYLFSSKKFNMYTNKMYS